MADNFQLPAYLEEKFGAQFQSLTGEARENLAIELFRKGELSHFGLGQMLGGLDQHDTNKFLIEHQVYEGSVTSEELERERKAWKSSLKTS